MPARYSRPAVILHWLIAAIALVLVFYHPSTEHGATPSALSVNLHASLGLLLLALMILRIGWRLRHPPPALPAVMTANERQQAGLMHGLLYALLLAAPLLGIFVGLASALDIRIAGLWLLPNPWSGADLHDLLRSLHGFSADLLLGLSVLHILAALRHQFVKNHDLLARMRP